MRAKVKEMIFTKARPVVHRTKTHIGRKKTVLQIPRVDRKIVVMVDGGFCSTLNKYAIGKCIELETGHPVAYDLHWFDQVGVDVDGIQPRNFELLNAFPQLPYETIDPRTASIYRRFFGISNDFPYLYSTALFQVSPPTYVDGYWENWRYLRKVESTLKKEFDFSGLALGPEATMNLSRIRGQHISVAIHVRRGDFVNLGLCILEPSYYIRAIQFLRDLCRSPDIHFFFFSDDLPWISQNIIPLLPPEVAFSVVDNGPGQPGYVDLYLISQCHHQVSSNSSFGFWGGFLNSNPGKIVVIPSRWTPETARWQTGSNTAHEFPGWIVLPA